MEGISLSLRSPKLFTMKTIFVYAGYYEMFVTDKKLFKSVQPIATFDNVPDAEDFVAEANVKLWLDRDIIRDSQFVWRGDDWRQHTFNSRKFNLQ